MQGLCVSPVKLKSLVNSIGNARFQPLSQLSSNAKAIRKPINYDMIHCIN